MMDQNIVKIEINGKFYPISCKIGEEERVIASGKLLSDIIGTLDNDENKISESKVLLMAALILADKNIRNSSETTENVSHNAPNLNDMVSWLEKLNLNFKNIERLINNS